MPRPEKALPDKAYEEFLAKGQWYEDGPFISVPVEELQPMEEFLEWLETERLKNRPN